MKSYRIVLTVLSLVLCGCATKPSQPAASDLARPATIKDIMDSMVDPSGDFLFESVVKIADAQGVREKAPRTDEEWKEVRRHALVLMEAPNLLAMEGRKVARPGEKAENPQVELQPEEIQKAIDGDRPAFIRRAKKLQDAAIETLKFIDVKDTKGLFDSLDGVDKACESCHLHYWYPNDEAAQKAAREAGIVD